MVKRIVGVPGDTLMMRDGMLYLNGAKTEDRDIREVHGKDEKLSGSMWRSRSSAHGASRHNWGPIVIQEDSYFMLGDNRDQSRDSRYWGPVSDGRLMARVVFMFDGSGLANEFVDRVLAIGDGTRRSRQDGRLTCSLVCPKPPDLVDDST